MTIAALVIGLGGTGQWVVTFLKKDLQEAHGEIPEGVILRAFDTVRSAGRVRVGAQATQGRQERVEERVVAGVRLEPGEHIHVGGFVKDYVKEVAEGKHPHVGSWLQADYYLRNLPDNSFYLDEGAGQFRQFGRLAVFYDLRAITLARLYGQLNDTIRQIQLATNVRNLQVFIIGSLAGGTGAGMFVDVAHLVRQIARNQAHMEVTLRGFLVLPDAFGAIPAGPIIMKGMQARAFAAMRENKRFAVNFKWDLGYPMHYQRSGEDPILRSAVKGRLFDYLYYVDGHRPNYPLHGIKLEDGVAPSISDMLSTVLDEDASAAFVEHGRNLEAVVVAKGMSKERTPYYGTLGTYSIVFPIDHFLSGFSHRLGLEVLELLLAPAARDEQTGVPTRLAADRNREDEGAAGRNAVRRFLRATQIADPNDPASVVENTLLTGEIERIARLYDPRESDTALIAELTSRTLPEWSRIFTPPGTAPDVQVARERAEAVLGVELTDEVPPSNIVKPKERTSDGAVRIEEGVRFFKNMYLGAEQTDTGQRVGGRYREALGEYSQVHVGRFQRMLEFRMQDILNGRSTTDPVQARGGKLGYLRDFLDGLYADLDTASGVLARVVEIRRDQGFGRRDAIASAEASLADMKASRDDTRPIIGRAHKTQAAYLAAEQTLIDLHKTEIMEQALAETLRQMRDLVESALQSVDGWIESLALHREGLYATLLRGRQQVEANRDADADVEVRLILGARKAGREEDEEYRRFREYEQERYEQYVRGGQADRLAQILAGLRWNTEVRRVAGQPRLSVALSFQERDAAAARFLVPETSRSNAEIFLAGCRQAFAEARATESVLNYLLRSFSDNPAVLADRLFERSGPLLARDGGAPVPANYLRVHHGQTSEETSFLRTVIARLASRSLIADPDKFARLVNSSDRFKCTLVYTLEVIELDEVSAYKNYRQEYLGYRGEQQLQGSRRAVLHVFPAEVNATGLEERLPELDQAVRLLDDDVVLQLEDQDKTRLFLLCYAYGLVNRHSWTEGDRMREVYRVQWDPVDEQDRGEVWLTDPETSTEPRLLETLMTFNYVGRDVGHGEGFYKDIAWAQLRWTLEQRRRADALRRFNEGTVGESDATIKGWLQSRPTGMDEGESGELDMAYQWAAQRDHLHSFVGKWEKMLEGMRPEGMDPKTRQDYDLVSVFTLLLRDEMGRLRRAVSGQVSELEKAAEKPTAPRPKTSKQFRPFA